MSKRIAFIAATLTSGIVVGEQLWSRVTSEGRFCRQAMRQLRDDLRVS